MGLTTNESSYIQAVSNRWDAALPSHAVALTTGVDFETPSIIYLTDAADVEFTPWDGSSTITMALPAGFVPIRMKNVVSVSAGAATRLF
jgi:hypothetical protein